MNSRLIYRSLWLALSAGLVLALLWLDHNRGGPASRLSRCNLLLSRTESPAADVLIVGSSRTGAALDPIAMQKMMANANPDSSPRVERIALGQSPLRSSHALLDNYFKIRGAPEVIVLEVMVMTNRSMQRLAQRELDLPPEHYIFRRDLNLMTFRQILNMPSIAMPFTENEEWFNLWRFRLRGVVLRAGALLYQHLRRPFEVWDLATCDRQDWTREPEWPADFAFSYDSFEPDGPPDEVIDSLNFVMADMTPGRVLQPWQSKVSKGDRYPYDFAEPYREGEVVLFHSMLEVASRHGVPVVLLPLPLYGYTLGAGDMQTLAESIPSQVHVFDLYGQIPGDLDKFWYDDGHVVAYPVGALATAILAQHLLAAGLLTATKAMPAND